MMKTFTDLFYALIYIVLMVNCSTIKGPNQDEIQNGEFKATITGDREQSYSGTATYEFFDHPEFEKEVFSLNLDAGTVSFIEDDDMIGSKWGIFLSTEFDSAKVIHLDNAALASWYMIPGNFTINYPDQATITIEENASNLISGKIRLKDRTDSGDYLEVSGRFKAKNLN